MHASVDEQLRRPERRPRWSVHPIQRASGLHSGHRL